MKNLILEKKISLKGDFAQMGTDIRNEDIIEILDEGTEVKGEYNGKPRIQYVFKIKTAGSVEKLLSFNQTSRNYLIDAYGGDTTKWIDKQGKIWIVKQMVQGKMKDIVYITAPDQILS